VARASVAGTKLG